VLQLSGPLTVQAVFERAWHVHSSNGQVLTMTTIEYDGPLGIRLSGTLPAMLPGTRGMIRGTTMFMGRLVISLNGAKIWTGQPATPTALSMTQLHRDQAALDAALASHAASGDFPGVRERLTARAAALREALVAGDSSGTKKTAAGLLGLGPGLTPAGDDLLVGLLAGLQVLGMRGGIAPRSGLAERIEREARTRTTALSRTFLHWAGRGVAAQPLLDVLWSLGSDSGIDSLDGLLSIGHTSGRDMLEGASLAVSVILGREKRVGPALAGSPQCVSRLGQADACLGGAC
jgi:hypothetical protein